jgi:AbrB family looped-hinge helix DNA binding protein
MPFMTTKVSVDKAGRVVLPKPLRDKLRLHAGDDLAIEADEDVITLRPIRPQARLRKKDGIWVYQGGPSDDSIPDLIDRVREERIRDLLK